MKPITSPSFKQAEFSRNLWHVTVTSLDDALKPDFWVHVAARLKPRDLIEVWAEDNSFRAELAVLSATKMSARVELLSKTEFEANKPSDVKGYEIKWRGAKKWSVMRDSDKYVMGENFQTRDEAELHLKTLLA